MDTDTLSMTEQPIPVTGHAALSGQDNIKREEAVIASDALPSPAADPVTTPSDDMKVNPLTSGELRQDLRTASPSPIIPAAKTSMTKDQVKYCGAIIRNLKKHRDSGPFISPVDLANVPDYENRIEHPMDLSTVDRKLSSCQYDTVHDFVADVRLIFSNCYKYNGEEGKISILCQNVESAFEKSLRYMPPSKEPTPPLTGSPGGFDGKEEKSSADAKALQSPPPFGRDSIGSRPKREIHPPPSKDYPEPMTGFVNPRRNSAQMKFCFQSLRELKKSKHSNINAPFLVPVDHVALNIPDYPTIVKNPMDISTIEHKLNSGMYESPEAFELDIRTMFDNCYLYNPPENPVYHMGKNLEKVFNTIWEQKPKPAPLRHKEEEDGLDSDEEEQDDKIAELERHIATISQQIASIKSKKKHPRSPKTSRRPSKSDRVKRKRPQKKKAEELPEFTFEQKKTLSERINNLSGDRLTTVVEIIQSSMPNLDGQGEEEIVLDIDALDRATLHRLHEFVTGKSLIPSSDNKRRRTQFKENSASRKIQALEKTLRKFNANAGYNANDSSSDSESDSSGSDSDDSGSSSD